VEVRVCRRYEMVPENRTNHNEQECREWYMICSSVAGNKRRYMFMAVEMAGKVAVSVPLWSQCSVWQVPIWHLRGTQSQVELFI